LQIRPWLGSLSAMGNCCSQREAKEAKPTTPLPHGERLVFDDIGVMVPNVLMPNPSVDMSKWAVIACDQYTAEKPYWQRLKETVGDSPSMLNLIYPEVYLPEKRDTEYINGIREKMIEYDDKKVFETLSPGFVLVDRKTPSVASRKGLVVALDLELYSFEKGSQSLIRATEATIEERLPPRIKVREQATIESPHILVLLDDPGCTVIEPLFAKRDNMKKLYDFDLMENSGHLTGHHVSGKEDVEEVIDALRKLADKKRFQQKYQAKDSDGPILFAVGDGNHSLATAKRCWEAVKASGASMDHPARHALVELNNVHDAGLDFHPIHRLVEDLDPAAAVEDMQKFLESQGSSVTFEEGAKLAKSSPETGCHKFEFVSKLKSGVFTIQKPKMVLDVATLDGWLNGYLMDTLGDKKKEKLDYVHEQYTIEGKSLENEKTMGFLLPTIDKNDLVKTVVQEGVLPRKTFSMGHAPEKRFYCECRRVQ